MATSRPGGLQYVFRNLRQPMKPVIHAAAVALALACVMPVAHVQAHGTEESGVRDIRSLNATDKQRLLERIRKVLRSALDHTKPLPGNAAYMPVYVKFRTEARNEVLVIDLGAANGPRSSGANMTEIENTLADSVTELLDEFGISYPAFDYEFGGKDWYYYNPDDRQHQLEYERRMNLKGGATAIPPQGAKAVISAMHGWYWRYFEEVWALQRPELSNGIYEDFITPTFVDPLTNYLLARSSVIKARPASPSRSPAFRT